MASKDEMTQAQREVLAVECPICDSLLGAECTLMSKELFGERRPFPHQARFDAAAKLPAPPVQQESEMDKRARLSGGPWSEDAAGEARPPWDKVAKLDGSPVEAGEAREPEYVFVAIPSFGDGRGRLTYRSIHSTQEGAVSDIEGLSFPHEVQKVRVLQLGECVPRGAEQHGVKMPPRALRWSFDGQRARNHGEGGWTKFADYEVLWEAANGFRSQVVSRDAKLEKAEARILELEGK